MGGKKSFLNNPTGSVGAKAFGENSFINKAINTVASSTMTMGLSTFNPNNEQSFLADGFKGAVQGLREGIGDITGANAMRKAQMDEISRQEAEARRQALLSDAMAREAGGDPTRISLNTGKRRAGSQSGGGTGIGGTGTSRDTGIQS